jgi:hypothetical protein
MDASMASVSHQSSTSHSLHKLFQEVRAGVIKHSRLSITQACADNREAPEVAGGDKGVTLIFSPSTQGASFKPVAACGTRVLPGWALEFAQGPKMTSKRINQLDALSRGQDVQRRIHLGSCSGRMFNSLGS